ncbi:PREDICTED: uncharacterized protein LOC104811242 [Tarenaya hassleriana]|uniref:uncharacterized protein LOC104811242 n=1 Tax=Tarenaya hassleriana TaxID=28532 RepID=UPI00053CA550|nr:PREDICTED: uncharacterized protein LOC104811242 [Tarenaya hassleriana]
MGRRILRGWCFVVAMAVTAAAVATAGRLELRNEISGMARGGRRGKLAVRCWSNEDDLGWDIIPPGDSRKWKFTTINFWPFPTTEFRCEFRTAFGTTKDDVVTVFSGNRGFQRKSCDGTRGDQCIWVAKKKGLYHRRIFKDDDGKSYHDDVVESPWVWKW